VATGDVRSETSARFARDIARRQREGCVPKADLKVGLYGRIPRAMATGDVRSETSAPFAKNIARRRRENRVSKADLKVDPEEICCERWRREMSGANGWKRS